LTECILIDASGTGDTRPPRSQPPAALEELAFEDEDELRAFVRVGREPRPGLEAHDRISQPSDVATSFTNTPGAKADGRHGSSAVFTHPTAPGSSVLIILSLRVGVDS
jgi:hypothetical protein